MIETLALIEDEHIVLDEAALALAALDHEDSVLEAEALLAPYLTRIAYMAAQLMARSAGIGSNETRAQMLKALIAEEHGFTGDESDFGHDAGADMMAMLDSGHGLPVTLSILYVGVARKVGWRAVALGVPGHVLIRVGDEPSAVYQDPFDDGRVLDARGLKKVLARVLGQNTTLDPAYMAPMGNRATLVRLMTNQAARARRAGDLERALLLHERMTAFAPGATALWWERARLEQQLGRLRAARASLVAMRETTRDGAMLGRIEAALNALARSAS
jgi:regulator of sirC expression with transglutaminase-like and TPR domain